MQIWLVNRHSYAGYLDGSEEVLGHFNIENARGFDTLAECLQFTLNKRVTNDDPEVLKRYECVPLSEDEMRALNKKTRQDLKLGLDRSVLKAEEIGLIDSFYELLEQKANLDD